MDVRFANSDLVGGLNDADQKNAPRFPYLGNRDLLNTARVSVLMSNAAKVRDFQFLSVDTRHGPAAAVMRFGLSRGTRVG